MRKSAVLGASILWASAIFGTAAGAAAQDMRGIVRDAKDEPVAGAWVEIRKVEHAALTASDYEADPFATARTSEDGLWAFAGLGSGLWILTAVAATEPLTEVACRELARPRADAALPAGVAVTRSIRRLTGKGHARAVLGLAPGAAATSHLRGRLTGAFDPGRNGYEVQVTFMPKPSGPGMHVTVFSSLSADFTGMPTQFTAVPDAEGRFDFGALDVGDRDFIEVVSFPLDEPGHELDGKPFHGQFLQLGQRDKGFDVPLAGQHVVTLRALGTVGSDDPIGFTLWDEKGGEISTERNEVSLRWNLTDGTWLARATQGDRASPLVGFRLASTEDADNAEDVGLVLQPCPAWTVHLVDQHGAPLADDFLKLGNDASAGFPAPCRVEASCEGGLVSLEGLFPGPYLVQFDGGSKRAFTVNLDLQPGDQPVTVNVPEAR